MAEFHIRDAADLFTKQAAAINSLWANYSSVTGVLIGLGVVGAKSGDIGVWPRIAASLAFAMFSYGNWVLIRQACTIQFSAKATINATLERDSEIPSEYSHMLKTLVSTANSVGVSSLYHFTIDAAVLLALWQTWLKLP
jgi:hypothetical protein